MNLTLEDKTIFITGGAGFIGSHLARVLARDNRVIIFDDLTTGSRSAVADLLQSARAQLVVGDIRQPADMHGLLDDVDIVFHLAVMNLRACMTDPLRAESVNVRGTLNVALEAQSAGIDRFIYVSSSDIYGDVDMYPTPETTMPRPTTIYGATKLAGELMCETLRRAQRFPALIVRPFNTYGPGEHVAGDSGEVLPRFIRYALAGRPLPIFGNGSQTRSFTHVNDTVRGLIAAAASGAMPDIPLNIASPHEVSILDAARAILDALDNSGHPLEFLPARPGDSARQAADVFLTEKVIGFHAETTLEQGLPSLITYIKGLDIPIKQVPRLWPGAS